MKVVHSKLPAMVEAPRNTGKKLPMDKDPRFLAELRREIINDHNKKILAKQRIANGQNK